MIERKKEIESLLRNYKLEKEKLESVITETEETKEKIIDSLKYLNKHLKKMNISDEFHD